MSKKSEFKWIEFIVIAVVALILAFLSAQIYGFTIAISDYMYIDFFVMWLLAFGQFVVIMPLVLKKLKYTDKKSIVALYIVIVLCTLIFTVPSLLIGLLIRTSYSNVFEMYTSNFSLVMEAWFDGVMNFPEVMRNFSAALPELDFTVLLVIIANFATIVGAPVFLLRHFKRPFDYELDDWLIKMPVAYGIDVPLRTKESLKKFIDLNLPNNFSDLEVTNPEPFKLIPIFYQHPDGRLSGYIEFYMQQVVGRRKTILTIADPTDYGVEKVQTIIDQLEKELHYSDGIVNEEVVPPVQLESVESKMPVNNEEENTEETVVTSKDEENMSTSQDS